MSRSVYLSKTDFLKYQVCPSYLWLWKYKPEVVPADEEEYIKRRKEQGNEVEKYARQLFPNAVLVETKNTQAKHDTEKLVADGVKTIFQATVFTDSGLFAMADVITYNNADKTWTLFEVKGTNSVKKEHIYDLAFQKSAFEEAGYEIGKTGVIFLNKEYRRKPTIVASEFLTQEDTTDKVDEILLTIKDQIKDALVSIADTAEPTSCSCRLRTRSNHCPTFKLLNPDIPEYSVFNITNMRDKKLASLIDEEIFNISDVPDDMKLSVPQKNQVEATKTGNVKIDKDSIERILDDLVFPLYFLDYETVSTAVPLYEGCRPYQQIPFQYSL
jgi:CRISPR/Cas system-associated exonuclease Cas4 (RecB family)